MKSLIIPVLPLFLIKISNALAPPPYAKPHPPANSYQLICDDELLSGATLACGGSPIFSKCDSTGALISSWPCDTYCICQPCVGSCEDIPMWPVNPGPVIVPSLPPVQTGPGKPEKTLEHILDG